MRASCRASDAIEELDAVDVDVVAGAEHDLLGQQVAHLAAVVVRWR